jgi:hypothetical protein
MLQKKSYFQIFILMLKSIMKLLRTIMKKHRQSKYYTFYISLILFSFVPSEKFKNCVISGNLEPGNNVQFFNQNVFFDIDYFTENKIYDNRHHDLVIELIALNDNNQPECTFCTFCKIYPVDGGKSYKIKPEMQKLKVNHSWFDIQDIYGFTSDNNECEICCNSKKDTIFLPCKHSYACRQCAITIRVRGNNCPICRQAISDSVVIENIE